jgi:dipeptidyl aminopeptidase/acylaminoacyl peptidase
MTYVRKKLPPILTIHGDADQTVPYEQGVRLTRAVRDAGGRAELIVIPNAGHGFDEATTKRVYEREIWPFLKKHGVLK